MTRRTRKDKKMAKWKVKRITVGDILWIMSPWSFAAVYDESIDEDKTKFYTYEDLEKCEFKNREVCAIHAHKKGLIDIFLV